MHSFLMVQLFKTKETIIITAYLYDQVLIWINCLMILESTVTHEDESGYMPRSRYESPCHEVWYSLHHYLGSSFASVFHLHSSFASVIQMLLDLSF